MNENKVDGEDDKAISKHTDDKEISSSACDTISDTKKIQEMKKMS